MSRRSPKAHRPGPGRELTLGFGLRVASLVAILGLAPFALERFLEWLPGSATVALRELTARVASWGVGLVGVPCLYDGGNQLYLSNHVLRIDVACTAVAWMIMFVVSVLVVPVVRNRKWQALSVGLPLILVANLVRLVLVAMVSEWAPQYFFPVHDRVLQASMAAVVIAIWAGFVWFARDDWKAGWG